jgi:hypothetical protein
MGLDLADLDLDHIDIDGERGQSPWWRWVVAVLLFGTMGFLLWLPQTELYARAGDWLFAVVSLSATVVGILGGRWLWRWAEEASERWAARHRTRTKEPDKPPSALQRWLTLLAALGGGGAGPA